MVTPVRAETTWLKLSCPKSSRLPKFWRETVGVAFRLKLGNVTVMVGLPVVGTTNPPAAEMFCRLKVAEPVTGCRATTVVGSPTRALCNWVSVTGSPTLPVVGLFRESPSVPVAVAVPPLLWTFRNPNSPVAAMLDPDRVTVPLAVALLRNTLSSRV